MGRPSKYTEEIATELCRRLADGESLNSICKGDEFPAESTVREWVITNKDGFSAKYATAREAGYLKMADELLDIADNAQNDWMDKQFGDRTERVVDNEALGRSKLRVDTRKWLLSKMLPKVYGDKITNEITGALAVTDSVDKPPNETREEWIARRKRELANGSNAIVGTTARAANGRNHS